jgi:hypothetical protein
LHDETDRDITDQEYEIAETPDLRDLVKSAFERARLSGKRPWEVMTIAVLKNRLLDITGHSFSESDYGAASMSSLVLQLPDLLDLDDSAKPPLVRLKVDSSLTVSRAGSNLQVRSDLWHAIIDYSRDEPFVWNGVSAVPQSTDSTASDLVLPTLSPDEEKVIRREFLEHASPNLDEERQSAVQQWIDGQKSPRILPGFLQKQWNEYLKERVVDRLRSWFRQNQLPEPNDLLVPPPPRLIRGQTTKTSAATRVEELRALVIRCVKHMTSEELLELRLPPQALLRGERPSKG